MSTLRTIEAQIPAEATNTRQALTLDGVQISIATKLLRNVGAWFFDLYDAQGQPIALGLRLSAGVDLLGPYHGLPGVPAGPLFVAWQGDGASQDPGIESFANGDAQIMYLEGASG